MPLVTTAALGGEGKCVVIPIAGASAPIHEEIVFSDVTFEDFYLSDACGTTVLDTVSVSLSATFFPAHDPEAEQPAAPTTGSAADPCGALTAPEQAALIEEARDAKQAESASPTLADIASVALSNSDALQDDSETP